MILINRCIKIRNVRSQYIQNNLCAVLATGRTPIPSRETVTKSFGLLSSRSISSRHFVRNLYIIHNFEIFCKFATQIVSKCLNNWNCIYCDHVHATLNKMHLQCSGLVSFILQCNHDNTIWQSINKFFFTGIQLLMKIHRRHIYHRIKNHTLPTELFILTTNSNTKNTTPPIMPALYRIITPAMLRNLSPCTFPTIPIPSADRHIEARCSAAAAYLTVNNSVYW